MPTTAPKRTPARIHKARKPFRKIRWNVCATIMWGWLLPVWDSACTRSLVLSLCRDRQWRMLWPKRKLLFSHKEWGKNWGQASPYYYHLKAIWETHSVWFFCGGKKKEMATLDAIMPDNHVSLLCLQGSSPRLQGSSSLTLPVQSQVWSSHFAERYLHSSFWHNKSPATPAI